jgi:glycosyltransferase involved in cell wall biosynthesis
MLKNNIQDYKTKILFVNHDESRSGAQRIVLEVGKEMKKHFNVVLVSLDKGSMHDEFINSFKNIIYPRDILKSFDDSEKARRILLREKPDLVYVNSIVSYNYAIEAKKLGIPVVLHVHELKWYFDKTFSDSEKADFKNFADIFIAVSEPVRNLLVNDYGCDDKQVVLINAFVNSVDILAKSFAKSLVEINQEINKNEGEIVIVNIGCFDKRKGNDIFVDCFKILENLYPGKFKFIWIGGPDKENVSYFENVKGLNKNLILLGEKENPFPYLRAADMFLLSSREDPFPLVALESMVLSKPIFAFKGTGGIPEVISNCGVVADLNAKSMANFIGEYLEKRNEIDGLGIKARKMQRENYDYKILIPKIKKLIDKTSEMSEKVSVILPSYNYDWSIQETIDSVLGQNYENWELIIVDDGSTDNSVGIIEKYLKKYPKKIKLFFHKGGINKGLAETYQLGLSKCSGRYVAFIEADDIWKKNYLSRKIPIFKRNKEVVVVYNNLEMFGDAEIIQKKGGSLKLLDNFSEKYQPFDMRKYVVSENPVFSFSNFMVRKNVIDLADFSEKYCAWLDWWILVQLSNNGKFYYLPEKLTKWRMHKKSYDYEYVGNLGESYVTKLEEMRKDIKNYLYENSKLKKDFLYKDSLWVSLFKKIEKIFSKIDFFQKGRSIKGIKNNAQEGDVKAICFYLPQYHTIPENDKWWGKGFTEWTNVRKAKPLFLDHYQPKIPSELGYYNLNDDQIRIKQAELAKEYGIYGFCYYYYWFNGKKLLDMPLRRLLETGKPDFPFCICWANENWTRRWDGFDKDILIKQNYSNDDFKNFIREVIPILKDDRYICINSKPLLIIYNPNEIPDIKNVLEVFRNECREEGVEVHLAMIQSFGAIDPKKFGFDSAIEFPPHKIRPFKINSSMKFFNPKFKGNIFDYKHYAERFLSKKIPYHKLYLGVMPSWDNSARRKNNSSVFINSSPENYKFWLSNIVAKTKQIYKGDDRLIFINAWNEWGEGCYLEPDKKYGRAYLEVTKEVLEGANKN